MQKQLNILLIEDDHDDIELLHESLKENNIDFRMDVVMEGDKVSTYISDCDDCPDIIVMDFNLPKLHGKEVLKEIKTSDKFKNIPVMVLSTSRAKEDIEFSYKMGASTFLSKPTTTAGFKDTVDTLYKIATRQPYVASA